MSGAAVIAIAHGDTAATYASKAVSVFDMWVRSGCRESHRVFARAAIRHCTDTGKSEKHHRPSRWLRYCGHAVFGYREGCEVGSNVLTRQRMIIIRSLVIVGINCMRKRGRDRCGQRSIIVGDSVLEGLQLPALPGTAVLGCARTARNCSSGLCDIVR